MYVVHTSFAGEDDFCPSLGDRRTLSGRSPGDAVVPCTGLLPPCRRVATDSLPRQTTGSSQGLSATFRSPSPRVVLPPFIYSAVEHKPRDSTTDVDHAPQSRRVAMQLNQRY